MRTLLLACFAALLAPRVAAACGGPRIDPPPRVLTVVSRSFPSGYHWARRSFVVLPEAADVDSNTRWIHAASYDDTAVSELAALATPVELTLIGPTGVRVVKANRQFAMRRWLHRKPRIALEIPADDSTIAIVGGAKNAQWYQLGYSPATAATRWWLEHKGIAADWTSVRPLAGTDIDVIATQASGTSTLVVRRGDDEVGRYNGTAHGAFVVNGRLYLVLEAGDGLYAQELPKAALLRS
jgi:hypothetical protein